jgi:hypothetical protein
MSDNFRITVYDGIHDDNPDGWLEVWIDYSSTSFSVEVVHTSHVVLKFLHRGFFDDCISDLPLSVQTIIKEDIHAFINSFVDDSNVKFDDECNKCTITKHINILTKSYDISIACYRKDPIKECEDYNKYVKILHGQIDSLKGTIIDLEDNNKKMDVYLKDGKDQIQILERRVMELDARNNRTEEELNRLQQQIQTMVEMKEVIDNMSSRCYNYSKVPKIEFKIKDQLLAEHCGKKIIKIPYNNGYRPSDTIDKERQLYCKYSEYISEFEKMNNNEFVWYHKVLTRIRGTREYNSGYYFNTTYIWITTFGRVLLIRTFYEDYDNNERVYKVELKNYNMDIPIDCMDMINMVCDSTCQVCTNGKQHTYDFCKMSCKWGESNPPLHMKFENDIIKILDLYKEYLDVTRIRITKM